MARELLGDVFDIHGGGNDLTFPHHENEIAQSRCAHPEGAFARIWIHNGMLNVEGQKMSKSVGNFFTVWDLRRRLSGMVIRHVLLSAHYRSPLDWTEARIEEAKSILNYWYRVSQTARKIGVECEAGQVRDLDLVECLENDLDTPAALRRVHRLAELARPGLDHDAMRSFLEGVGFLGFKLSGTGGVDVSASVQWAFDAVDRATAYLDAKAEAIHAARLRKDFIAADDLRKELEGLGVSVQSTRDETTWSRTVDFDPKRVAALSMTGRSAN